MEYEIEIHTPQCEAEFMAVWRFNYEVFAAELRMRPRTEEPWLADPFHYKNLYRVARHRITGRIVGLIAAHWQPPYSVAAHFGPEAAAPPAAGKLAEIRLFAVAPDYRKTTVAARLGIALLLDLESRQVTELVISGISVQKRFYERLGFRATGAPVAAGDTRLYPMRAELRTVLGRCRELLCFKIV